MMTQQQELNIKPSFQQQELGTAEEVREGLVTRGTLVQVWNPGVTITGVQ